MATTNTMWVLDPTGYTPPATLYATTGVVADTSTPVGYTPVLKYDATTAWWAYFWVTCPSNYAGGGFTASWKGGTDNTSVGTLILDIGIKTVADATILTGDLGLDTQTRTGISDTPPTTPTDKLNYSTTGVITHANAGSPAVGNRMVIIAKRDVADTNTGVLQLAEILILET